MTSILTVPYVCDMRVLKPRKRNVETVHLAGSVDVAIEDLEGAELVMKASYVPYRNASRDFTDVPRIMVVQKDGAFWRQAVHGRRDGSPMPTVRTDELETRGAAGDARLVPSEIETGRHRTVATSYEALASSVRRIDVDGRSAAVASILKAAADVAFLDGDVYVRCREPVLEEVNLYPRHFLVATMGGESGTDPSRSYLRRADKAGEIVELYRSVGEDILGPDFLSVAPEILRPDLLSFDEDAHAMGVDGRRLLEWVTNQRIMSDPVASGRAAALISAALPMLNGDEVSVIRGASDIAKAALICADGAYHDPGFCRAVDRRYRKAFGERAKELQGMSPTSIVTALGFAFGIEAGASSDPAALAERLRTDASVAAASVDGRNLVVVMRGGDEAAAQAMLRDLVDEADAASAPGF